MSNDARFHFCFILSKLLLYLLILHHKNTTMIINECSFFQLVNEIQNTLMQLPSPNIFKTWPMIVVVVVVVAILLT